VNCAVQRDRELAAKECQTYLDSSFHQTLPRQKAWRLLRLSFSQETTRAGQVTDSKSFEGSAEKLAEKYTSLSQYIYYSLSLPRYQRFKDTFLTLYI